MCLVVLLHLDDNLSRLFSEYLGIETMLAVVCKTRKCVEALERYDREGCIDKISGLHGLATAIGQSLNGQYSLVICLEDLSRLDLLEPKLPNGETPPGFLGFAVNMIKIQHQHLSFVTTNGHGLKATLFYHLFSRLQVYRTRKDMLQVLPLISHGAISLDGGMLRSKGVFCLGNRMDIGLKFPRGYARTLPPKNYLEIENLIKKMKLKKETLLEDIAKEQAKLDDVMLSFQTKKQEFQKFLDEMSAGVSQIS